MVGKYQSQSESFGGVRSDDGVKRHHPRASSTGDVAKDRTRRKDHPHLRLLSVLLRIVVLLGVFWERGIYYYFDRVNFSLPKFQLPICHLRPVKAIILPHGVDHGRVAPRSFEELIDPARR